MSVFLNELFSGKICQEPIWVAPFKLLEFSVIHERCQPVIGAIKAHLDFVLEHSPDEAINFAVLVSSLLDKLIWLNHFDDSVRQSSVLVLHARKDVAVDLPLLVLAVRAHNGRRVRVD